MNKTEDEQHLQLLSIFHYIVAGFAAFFACFPIIHFILGVGLIITALTQPEEAVPLGFVGLIFVLVGSSIILFGWAFAVCLAVAGRFLWLHRHYTYCMVMAGIACVFTPFGTVLGVFTLIVLSRQSVRELFQQPAHASEAASAV